MNKLYIIWLSIISFVLLIAVTVMITAGVSRGDLMMRGGARAEIVSSQENCTGSENQGGKGLRRNAGAEGQCDTLKQVPATTTTVPANTKS